MAYGRRRVSAPIITEKHIGQITLASIAFGAVLSSVIAEAVAVTDKNAQNEVDQGSLVKAVFLERWITSDDAEQSTFVMIVEKIPAGQANPTATQMAQLNSYPNKKNILLTKQGITNPVAGVAMPLISQWVAIPRGKQRMGLGDKIVITVLAQADGINICGLNLFKEWK